MHIILYTGSFVFGVLSLVTGLPSALGLGIMLSLLGVLVEKFYE